MARTTIGGDQVLDGTLTDADISATAAIQGTKVSPNFGSQTVYTTGTVGINVISPSSSLDVLGAETVRGIAAPALAPAGTGRVYFDSTLNKLLASENGGAYTALINTNTVTGTSTTGRVAFWNGTSTVTGDTNLFWNNAAKFLGIGTNFPGTPLHVVGPSSGAITILDSNQAVGKVLTSDGSGVGTWQTPSSVSASIAYLDKMLVSFGTGQVITSFASGNVVYAT